MPPIAPLPPKTPFPQMPPYAPNPACAYGGICARRPRQPPHNRPGARRRICHHKRQRVPSSGCLCSSRKCHLLRIRLTPGVAAIGDRQLPGAHSPPAQMEPYAPWRPTRSRGERGGPRPANGTICASSRPAPSGVLTGAKASNRTICARHRNGARGGICAYGAIGAVAANGGIRTVVANRAYATICANGGIHANGTICESGTRWAWRTGIERPPDYSGLIGAGPMTPATRGSSAPFVF